MEARPFRDGVRRRGWMKLGMVLGALCATMLCVQMVSRANGDDPQSGASDLTQMSIEDLMNLQVTSVSRKSESLYDTAAAVYVITQEDIRRSGATSIAEALRMVPGLQVAQTNGNTWVVTSRGFADRWANKLLVLQDGRTLYTPLFSGTYWDAQDTMLEDIERIEIVRGPGATMWGANAVNGIINIITKSADETYGGLTVVGQGREQRGAMRMRYGGALGTKGHFRFYTKYFDRGDTAWRWWPGSVRPDGAGDSWDQSRAGFRFDWELSKQDSLVVQGDMYDGEEQQVLEASYLTQPYQRNTVNDIDVSGGNVLARWNRLYSNKSDATLQFYYDWNDREEMQFGEKRNTWDLDFQARRYASANHEIIWGLGYRYTEDETPSTFWVSFNPAKDSYSLMSAFVQDNITLKPNKVRLTLGSKLEHNSYTGFEVQPNVRFLWTPSDQNTVWAAVSRAVRTPARWERSGRVNNSVVGDPSMPQLVAVLPNQDFESENLLAYELGYRARPAKRFSFDIASFYNIYRHLRAFASGTPYLEATPAPAHVVLPIYFANERQGRTVGYEISANWSVTSWWKLSGGRTALKMDLSQDPSSLSGWLSQPILDPVEGSPRKHYSIRSYMDMPGNLELDVILYVMGRVPRTNVPPWKRLDVRLSWRPKDKNVEFSLIGQNLLALQQSKEYHYEHREFDVGLDEKQTQMEREIFGQVTWEF